MNKEAFLSIKTGLNTIDIDDRKIKLFHGNCLDIIEDIVQDYKSRHPIIVSDPPFNIGYKYNNYKDNLPEEDYISLMGEVFSLSPCVIIHYPESLYKISYQMGMFPDRVVSWVYNSNTARQHRDVAFFNVKPDFRKVRQPYKNLNDKRIQKRIAEGKTGAKLYDWWNINQVKNVSKDKTAHPCQMPVEVMENIIGILPDDIVVIDPFMGSGTTGIACKKHNIPFIGIEQDSVYFDIAKQRLQNYEKSLHIDGIFTK